MQKIVAAALIMIAATPALGAEYYYVVQDPTTQICEIGKYKPDGQTMVMVGTEGYTSKDEAKAARKAAPQCKKTSKDADN